MSKQYEQEKIDPIFKKPMIVESVTYNSSVVDGDQKGAGSNQKKMQPLGSLSKFVGGLAAALMATEGLFDIDDTMEEVLEKAKKTYPERSRGIEDFQGAISKTPLNNVKMSELLNHTSGTRDNLTGQNSKKFYKKFQSEGGIDIKDYIQNKLVPDIDVSKSYQYSNDGILLSEKALDFLSPTGSFAKEIENRIIKPLGIKIQTVNSLSKEEVGSVIVPPGGVYFIENKGSSYKSIPSSQFYPLGEVPLTAGGLCASVKDFAKLGEEAAKLYTGLPNVFTRDASSKAKAIFDKASTKTDGRTDKDASYSLGLYHKEKDGVRTIFHDTTFPNYTGLLIMNVSKEGVTSKCTLAKFSQFGKTFVNEELMPALLPKGGGDLFKVDASSIQDACDDRIVPMLRQGLLNKYHTIDKIFDENALYQDCINHAKDPANNENPVDHFKKEFEIAVNIVFAQIMAENDRDDMVEKCLKRTEELGLPKEERIQFLKKQKDLLEEKGQHSSRDGNKEIHARFNDGPIHDRILHTIQKIPGKPWVDRASEKIEGRDDQS